MSKSKTILITGGAGFIGSNTLLHLFGKYPDYRYIILDALTYAGDMRSIPAHIQKSPNFTFVHGDVRDSKVVSDCVSRADTVIHFAAETHVARSISDNTNFFETDVIGTQRVANAVSNNRDRIDRFIHISTSEVYGTARSELIDENHPLNPQSPYAAAKTGADRLVYAYHACYKIPAVIIRPFNMYGPRQHPEKAIPRFITSCVLGEPLTIHGTGQSQRDYTYVEDLVQAIDLVLHAPKNAVIGEVFNVGSGKSYAVRDIANLILEMMRAGSPQNPSLPPMVNTSDRPGQVLRHAADVKKIQNVLGWRPTTDFADGMKKTIEWYKENQDWWKDKLHMRHVPIEVERGRVELH
ncbi:NAD-dependent epimerase/dehydratase family protein [Candidatus Parcubacteria bacterium]|nr:MAG: NAD-dependent epimerase/dehydratase family protein [Candidatus Parcubacteria bacterium]